MPHQGTQLRGRPWWSVSSLGRRGLHWNVCIPSTPAAAWSTSHATVVSAEREDAVAGPRKEKVSACRASTRGRGLTLRPRRGPTASHQARAGGTRYIFTGPGLASCRRSRLNSNVRPRGRQMRHASIRLVQVASPRWLPAASRHHCAGNSMQPPMHRRDPRASILSAGAAAPVARHANHSLACQAPRRVA